MTSTARTQTIAPKLMYLVTYAGTVRFLRGQLTFMRQRGFEVFVVSSPGEDLEKVAHEEDVVTLAIPMQREIHAVKDFISLWQLIKLMRQVRPDVVVAGTPKAGLLGMLAACLTRVSVRIYLLHGLRLETTRGLKRIILSVAERITSACATRVICVSESLRSLYVQLGLASRKKTTVVNHGSANGVDAEHFRPPEEPEGENTIRSLIGIPAGAPVVGYAGRFTRDKGIVELLEAFKIVLKSKPQTWLLLVGDFEEGDPVPQSCIAELKSNPQIAVASFVDDPLPYYQAMDVLAYASHREGLGMVPLEAAAVGVPCVAFRVTGTIDAVEDGVTGTLVPLGNHASFAQAIENYIDKPILRNQHGRAGRDRVQRLFSPGQMWQAFYEECISLMRSTGVAPPRKKVDEVKVTNILEQVEV